MPDNTNKTSIVDPDPNDPTNNVIDLPDGTVAFTQKGYDRWKPLFARIGIDIDRPMTSNECCEYMFIVAETRPDRSPEEAGLLAIFELDPVKKAQYEREAEPFREKVRRADRMEGLGLRVVEGAKPSA